MNNPTFDVSYGLRVMTNYFDPKIDPGSQVYPNYQ